MPAWRSVTIGVSDLDAAAFLWTELFGFEVRVDWHDHEALAQRWNLPSGLIQDSRLLAAPGTEYGWVRLVSFLEPAAPIRQDARPWDLCAKNLDVRVDDLPARLPRLAEAGCRFLNEDYSEVTAPNGTRFREMHMHAHDGVNIVLLEVMDDPLEFSAQGFTGISTLVTSVDDLPAERRFYEQAFALEATFQHVLEGPEVTRMIGLPEDASLELCVLQEPGIRTGQMELIHYRGVSSASLYPKARPPACGLLDVEFQRRPASFRHSPAGFRIAG